jgi:hypothetical protein
MLCHFPQVRDEESTYSIFSRLQFALQPRNYEFIGIMLFNKRSEVGRLNFQNSFDYLCNNLPSNFTPESFLHNNTIFPLFIPFISIEKQEKALEYFKGSYPDKINRCLAMINIDRQRKYIRVCKECVKEDFNLYGEPYYRRQHEIELNRMCHKHKVPLYEYILSNYPIPRRYEDYCTVLSNSQEISIPEKLKESFLNIAQDINAIFTLNLSNWNIEITKNKISNKIYENGFVTSNGLKLQQKICEDFKKSYSEEFLDCIGCNFDVNSKSNWVRKVTTNYPDVNPLKFILFIRYLFGGFYKFHEYSKEYTTFKKGPYPCLNTVCPNHNKLVIKEIYQINRSNICPVATFKCDHCGYTYSRRGPDKDDADIYIKTSVKDRGHLWYHKLKECIDKNLGFKEKCKILGTKDVYLRTRTNKNTNSHSKRTSKAKSKYTTHNLLLKRYRLEILNFMKGNSDTTIKNIFNLNQKAYKYLFRNDNEWLSNTVINPLKKNITISKEERMKNYWLNTDKLLVEKLLKAISKIKSERAPYKRITIYTLQQYTKYGNFVRHKSKLPNCSKILNSVCETILDYQKRRINYVMNRLANSSSKITTTKILNGAHIKVPADQEILSYIEKKLKEYNHGNIISTHNND